MSKWTNYQLGDIGYFANGVNKNKNSFGHGSPFVNLLDIFDKDTIEQIPKGLVKVNPEELIRYNLKDGDILFVRSSVKLEGVGKVCVVTKDLVNTIYSGFVIRFRQHNETLDKYFSSFYLNSDPIRRQVIAKGTLSANSNINQESLKTIKIKVPSLNEQRKIARILSTADAVIEKTRAAIAKYKAVKQGMLHDLFTRGIDPHTGTLRPKPADSPELYKDSPLGKVPKDWDVEKVENLFEMILGKMLNTAAKSGEDQFPYLANRNVLWDSVDLSDLDMMNFSETERQRLELKFGDLLICEGGAVGRTAMWRGEMTDCYFQKAIHRLRANQKIILPQFMLAFMIYANENGFLTNFISQTSIAHLTQEKLAILPVLLPKIKEQDEIVKRFSVINSKIQTEQNYLAKLQSIKAGLMTDLLSGKKTVKVKGKTQ